MAKRIAHPPTATPTPAGATTAQSAAEAAPKRRPGRPPGTGSGAPANPTLSLRPDAEQAAWLKARASEGESLHGVLRESFDRYRALLALGTRACGGLFTPREFFALCDACNGTLFGPETLKYLHISVEDGDTYDNLGARWGIDAASVAARIEALPDHATFALADAVERFWTRAQEGEAHPQNGATMLSLGIAPAEGL